MAIAYSILAVAIIASLVGGYAINEALPPPFPWNTGRLRTQGVPILTPNPVTLSCITIVTEGGQTLYILKSGDGTHYGDFAEIYWLQTTYNSTLTEFTRVHFDGSIKTLQDIHDVTYLTFSGDIEVAETEAH